MKRSCRIVKASFLFGLTLLCACTAAPKHADTYTDSAGATLYLESDRDSCVRSCNVDFDRCGETKAAKTPVGRGDMTGILGSGAECKDSLKTCLAGCRKR